MEWIMANAEEIRVFLDEFDRWSHQNNKLHRDYEFDSFTEAFGFISEVALYAERINHHPDWFNSYKRVVIDLTTHEAGGVTEQDFHLGKKIEAIAEKYGGQ